MTWRCRHCTVQSRPFQSCELRSEGAVSIDLPGSAESLRGADTGLGQFLGAIEQCCRPMSTNPPKRAAPFR
ncbi:hypothetical protein BDV96DRAFT_571638 [Lophiotrema nucula]|uniref:Uncharacterized protein n=1 Tax=Lophiotrema nucula TaxID=690887 RepID=A0A6A5ZDK6_9PLEO|nr:hypothetical protein BDV96DRAFT_571638 [Lophiotrema nucula]